MRAIKKDMRHQTHTLKKRILQRILHCKKCSTELSGKLLDCWNDADDWEFFCDCGGEMELVEKIVTITYV
jgi:hypothetical protein